jgi:hypothetical protein
MRHAASAAAGPLWPGDRGLQPIPSCRRTESFITYTADAQIGRHPAGGVTGPGACGERLARAGLLVLARDPLREQGHEIAATVEAT